MEGSSSKGSAREHIKPDSDTCLSLFKHGKESSERPGNESCEITEKQEGKEVAANERSYKKSKQRHTPEQTRELESFFKACPLPSKKQRQKLSQKLGLETTQIKFWFQNRRTQVKNQAERKEKHALKQAYERLNKEVDAMKEIIGNPLCKDCGALVFDEQVRAENAKLKEELIRVCGMLENPMAKRTPLMANSFTQLGTSNISLELSLGRSEAATGSSLGGLKPVAGVKPGNGFALASSSLGFVSSEYLQVAVAAMNELLILAHEDSPFWLKSLDGEREMFDKELYGKKFNYHGANPFGFLFEATRATGLVINTSSELVSTLMDPIRWAELFPGMIGRVSVIEVLSSGVEETHDGKLLMMSADLLYPSPLVPLRHIKFIRYCKKHPDGTWVVVDVSVDPIRKDNADVAGRCRKLPSGCLVKDLPNGHSLVTFVEHFEYDESTVHSLFRQSMQSGLCYGAKRWLATLQRHCGCSAYLAKSARPNSHIGFTREGFESVLKLTKRVLDSYCFGICASSVCRWEKLKIKNITPEMQVMTQVNICGTGQFRGIIMSLATSVWLPISRHTLFDFLSNPHLRAHWDLLSPDRPMQEVVRIVKSPEFADRISILLPLVTPDIQVNTAILQEAWEDAVSSAVVFSAVDITGITEVMQGGDPGIARLLPSGFMIADSNLEATDSVGAGPGIGSLVTLGFQTLMANSPTAKITVESIETVNCLMKITVGKIKATLLADHNAAIN